MFVDKDYQADDALETLKGEAKKSNLLIVAWNRMEIENYFLCPELIFSYVLSRSVVPVDKDEVFDLVRTTIDELAIELPDLIADALHAQDRNPAITTLMKRARDHIRDLLAAGGELSDLISGKQAIYRISHASQQKWNVQLSPMSLCRHMRFEEIPTELKEAVGDLA